MGAHKCPQCGVRLTTALHLAEPKKPKRPPRVPYYDCAKMRDEGKTLDAIGQVYGVSGEYVRQVLAVGPKPSEMGR